MQAGSKTFHYLWFKHIIRKEGRKKEWKERKERFLFNNAIKDMVNDHSDCERANPLLLLHELFFPISRKGSFICTIPWTGYYIP